MKVLISFLCLLAPMISHAGFDSVQGAPRARVETREELAVRIPLQARHVFETQHRIPLLKKLGLPNSTPTDFEMDYDRLIRQATVNNGQYICRSYGTMGPNYICRDVGGQQFKTGDLRGASYDRTKCPNFRKLTGDQMILADWYAPASCPRR